MRANTRSSYVLHCPSEKCHNMRNIRGLPFTQKKIIENRSSFLFKMIIFEMRLFSSKEPVKMKIENPKGAFNQTAISLYVLYGMVLHVRIGRSGWRSGSFLAFHHLWWPRIKSLSGHYVDRTLSPYLIVWDITIISGVVLRPSLSSPHGFLASTVIISLLF